jgi:hypothetical protein
MSPADASRNNLMARAKVWPPPDEQKERAEQGANPGGSEKPNPGGTGKVKRTRIASQSLGILHSQAGKALAMWLYNVGAASLTATSGKFSCHPEWRSV